jgi:hypothetical protein
MMVNSRPRLFALPLVGKPAEKIASEGLQPCIVPRHFIMTH